MPRVTGLCEGNLPVTGEFPAQKASNAENVSIWWRHHGPAVSKLSARAVCVLAGTSRKVWIVLNSLVSTRALAAAIQNVPVNQLFLSICYILIICTERLHVYFTIVKMMRKHSIVNTCQWGTRNVILARYTPFMSAVCFSKALNTAVHLNVHFRFRKLGLINCMFVFTSICCIWYKGSEIEVYRMVSILCGLYNLLTTASFLWKKIYMSIFSNIVKNKCIILILIYSRSMDL